MNWWQKLTAPPPEPPRPEPEVFIMVRKTYEHWTHADYWPVTRYRTHETGDGRLVIQRDGQREPACTYADGGWVFWRPVVVRPDEIDFMRGDKLTPKS